MINGIMSVFFGICAIAGILGLLKPQILLDHFVTLKKIFGLDKEPISSGAMICFRGSALLLGLFAIFVLIVLGMGTFSF